MIIHVLPVWSYHNVYKVYVEFYILAIDIAVSTNTCI